MINRDQDSLSDENIADINKVVSLALRNPSVQLKIRDALVLRLKPNYGGVDEEHIEKTLPDAIEFAREKNRPDLSVRLEELQKQIHGEYEMSSCDCDHF